MPPTRRKPPSNVIRCLSETEFNSGLFSPWLCELRQKSLSSFCDLVNRLIKRLEVSPEIYSFFPKSPLTDRLVYSKKRQDSFEPAKVTNRSATIICVDNIWHWDPVSAVSAYLRSASVIDQILIRLPCSDEGHTYVDWCQLSKSKNFPSLHMILGTTTSDAGRQLLEDLFLCHKQPEEIKLIRMALIDVALNLNSPDVDQLLKSSDPFKIIPRSVFNTLCQRKRYDCLPVIELAVAASQVVTSEGPKSGASITLEGVLRRYENALLLAHCEDASSDVSLLTDNSVLKNCRPIFLNAIRDISQLQNLEEMLLVLIRLIGLLPARGCNPSSSTNHILIDEIDAIFSTEKSETEFHDSVVKRLLDAHGSLSIGRCLLNAAHRRHLLPAYRESVQNAGFPQIISPVVQMFRDLVKAHQEPSAASPALQSLCHRPTGSSSTKSSSDLDSSKNDPSLFSNVSKLISMSRIGVSRQTPQPYSPNLVILVVYGTITWNLAREIVDAATRNASEPLEVLIVCNYLLRGNGIFEQSLLDLESVSK